MVPQNFKILLEKETGTFRESSLDSLSDTKQSFTVPRGKQRCMEKGLCNICIFCTCLLCLCSLLIEFFQLDMIFSIAFIFRN